jgi:hypothetical protein
MLFATAPDGTRLPVIDITNPAFATPDETVWRAEKARYFKVEQARSPLSRGIMQVLLKLVAGQSKLIQAVQASRGGYMSGLATYVLKLGPDNLPPPYAGAVDRKVAESIPAVSLRVRLAGIATLLADSLVQKLGDSATPLHLIDIAGGPSACPLNALLRLRRDHPELLAGRRIEIVTYDIDAEGPAFAQNALAALQTGPLAGVEVALRHVPGGWHELGKLQAVLDAIPVDDIVIASSEGGLFDYGTEAEIVAVLKLLAPRVDAVAGSVTGADEATRQMYRRGRAKVIPRGLELFGRLAAEGGYRIARTLPAPFSDQVLLTRA